MDVKGKIMPIVLAMLTGCSFILGNNNIAEAANDPYSDVWIEVIEKDLQQKVSVTVPTTFAFVVNGTTDATQQVQISVDNKTLLLPNVTISVTNSGSSSGDYEINISGPATLPFKNYSTITAATTSGGAENFNSGIRQGTKVLLSGYIENEDTPIARNYWNVVAKDSEVTIAAGNFKNYRVSLESHADTHIFNTKKTGETNRIWLDKAISLEKPVETDGYDVAGFAKTPSIQELVLHLDIGGYRGQYSQIEQSVKAGKIIWMVEIDQ